MKALAGVTGLVAIALGLCAWAGSARAGSRPASAARIPEPRISAPPLTLRSSRLVLDGRVRCTATVGAHVRVGQSVSVGFTLRNITKRPVKVSLWVLDPWVVLKAADGTTYDTRGPLAGFSIPPPIPIKIAPGAKLNAGPQAISVRWPGPLQVMPGCLGKTLPALSVRVAAPGPPADESSALEEVVAAAGGLFDKCRPQTAGVPAYGQIYPPSGDGPPMNAQCSMSIQPEGSFWVAQTLVVTPAGLPGVQITQPYETLWPTGQIVPLASKPPYEAIAWEFVVTRYGATPVAASTLSSTMPSNQLEPSWYWNGAHWEREGLGSCGSTAFYGGGTGAELDLVSACSS